MVSGSLTFAWLIQRQGDILINKHSAHTRVIALRVLVPSVMDWAGGSLLEFNISHGSGTWGQSSKVICLLWLGDRLLFAPMRELARHKQLGKSSNTPRDGGPWWKRHSSTNVSWFFRRGCEFCESWAIDKTLSTSGQPIQECLHQKLQHHIAEGFMASNAHDMTSSWLQEFDQLAKGE